MSRYANQNESDLALNICNMALNKTSVNCHNGHHQHKTMILSAADRFVPNSSLEKALLALLPKDGAEEGRARVEQFMEEQRTKLLQEARHSAEMYAQVETYMGAVKQVKKHIMDDEQEKKRKKESDEEEKGENDNDKDGEETTNYGDTLRQMLESEAEKHAVPPQEHETYVELCSALGIAVSASANNGGDEEDEDVVMDTTQAKTNTSCPITLKLMEDPVKNTQCGHSYSKLGIESLISNSGGRCNCPVAGCGNSNVTLSQLKPDDMMAISVRRAKKREEATQQQMQRQQNTQLVDSDEEEEL